MAVDEEDENKIPLISVVDEETKKSSPRHNSISFRMSVHAQHLLDATFNAEEDDEEEEWSIDHVKLLYLMSRYAVFARTASEKEAWIRQVPILVLLYEGIVKGVFDFDYAPSSVLITWNGKSKRSWMNISQEGKSAIEDLRELKMVNGLKLTTVDFQPVTAYQVSAKGVALLGLMDEQLKHEVDAFICAPDSTNLLSVKYSGSSFYLANDSYKKESLVTETEDVSYVSSPYLPNCIRSNSMFRTEATSNKHRAYESAAGGNTIQDELDEAIVLGNVNSLVGEWIPFGSNQIVALNERLGALDRCQGGLFTSMVDKSPTDTKFEVAPGLTQVKILDYDFVRFINFEAEIHYPENDGVVQIENFGMHLNVEGSILYGIKIESILDRQADDISLDHLSRLLVDVHQDSSAIMNDLLSQYQLSLLDMIFMGDVDQRNKYNLIFATNISPKLSAEDYLDRSSYENELKQVLGDLRECYDISKDDILLVGHEGCLVCGPNIIQYEVIMVQYIGLLARENFISNYFARIFVLDDTLKNLRRLILSYKLDPNHVSRIRELLNESSKDVILLQEVLQYLIESVQDLKVPEVPKEPEGIKLYKCLTLKEKREDTIVRCKDLLKLIEGSHNQLETLQQMNEVINTQQLEDVFKSVNANTKYLVDASAAQERSSASLEVMQIILAGSFAFDIVDRISGGTLNISVPSWVVSYLVDPIISVPFLWWLINMLWLLLVSLSLSKLMKYLASKASGALTLRVQVDRKISSKHLFRMIKNKKVKTTDTIHESSSRFRKVAWVENQPENWGGCCPNIEVLYDENNGFLLSVLFQIDTKTTNFREKELLEVFTQMLIDEKVYFDNNAPKMVKMGSSTDSMRDEMKTLSENT